MDFAKGYKTVSGVLIVVLSTVLNGVLSGDEVVNLVTEVGQFIGAGLAIYGALMKIYRYFKIKTDLTE